MEGMTGMHLREYSLGMEVPKYGNAISPGLHCPLFGVCAVMRSIAGITVIYLGTNDCVYFAKKQYLSAEGHEGEEKARVVAAELSDSDLIFGIGKELKELIKKEYEKTKPDAVYVVTSCSVEVISEDVEGLIRLMDRELPCKVELIKTENFKTVNYQIGIENALDALARGIKKRERRPKTFAVLGARFAGADECEPVKILLEHGYTLHSILPFRCGEEQIQTLGEVEFTLVVDPTGRRTAERLRQEYDIPFFLFDQMFSREAIVRAYEGLQELTGIELSGFIRENLADLRRREAQTREKVKGKRFLFAVSGANPFECCLYLTDLEMIPLCLFLGTSMDRDSISLERLKERCNPELLQIANTDAIIAKLREYRPDCFIGGTVSPNVLSEHGTAQAGFAVMPVERGFSYLKKSLGRLQALSS